ncbi:MAG: hypothetical protein LBI42_10840 [Chitinispirillales bacterium]|jgi:hypothetical protein|nr:hypothetical protein [Chitinispirillales bacterium]
MKNHIFFTGILLILCTIVFAENSDTKASAVTNEAWGAHSNSDGSIPDDELDERQSALNESEDNDTCAALIIPPADNALLNMTQNSELRTRESKFKGSETLLGVGAGMSIGSIPLFTMWKNSLPDSIVHMGIPIDFGKNELTGDTAALRYTITNSPEEFNVILPVNLSVYNIKNDRIATLGLSFFYTSKQFQSMIFPYLDTLNRRVNIDEKLHFYSLSLEAGYQKAISPAFFSIDGSQKTLFSLYLAASPLNFFKRNGSVKTSVPKNDERIHSVADSVREKFSYISANGSSLSWRLGFTTLKRYSDKGGLETGLFYGGSYNALFYNKGSRIAKSKIFTAENESDKNLSFLQSKIELRVTLLRSIRNTGAEIITHNSKIEDRTE